MQKEKAIVVTTERGVFFGYVPEDTDLTNKILRLTNGRMCVKWPADQHGVVGLAAVGPITGARISPAAPSLTVHSITLAMECSAEAVHLWEAEPWN